MVAMYDAEMKAWELRFLQNMLWLIIENNEGIGLKTLRKLVKLLQNIYSVNEEQKYS